MGPELMPQEEKGLSRQIENDVDEAMHPELKWTDTQWAAYEKQQEADEDRANDYD